METELSPELAVHTLPLASTAMPEGVFSEPKPLTGEIAVAPLNSEIEEVFANHALPAPS